MKTWRDAVKNHVRATDLNELKVYDKTSEDLFALKIPAFLKQQIDFSNPDDPILLQTLPHYLEHEFDDADSEDPVSDLKSLKSKGILHKYYGRILLIATGTCAVNCRYCFRRNFPYTKNNASAGNWSAAITYIKQNPEIHEVILSGGDPLMLSCKVLNQLSLQLENIQHVKTIRIHTRIPVVAPERINQNFLQWLDNIKLNKVMVLHCNHPSELTEAHKDVFHQIKKTDTTLLNQSVLLNKINDTSEILVKLSHKLFDMGVLPYYLHQLDKAKGTKHFRMSDSKAKELHKEISIRLPGYLVPKLVREIPGKNNKTPII